MSLASVLDDGDPVLPGAGEDPVHVGGLAVKMHREDRPRARRDRAGDRVRVEVEGLRIHVHEDRPCPRREYGETGERGRERGGDDLVPRTHPEGDEAELQRLGAVRHGHRLAGVERRLQLLLERLDLGAEDEPPRIDDAAHGLVELVAQGGDPGLEVDERDLRHQR